MSVFGWVRLYSLSLGQDLWILQQPYCRSSVVASKGPNTKPKLYNPTQPKTLIPMPRKINLSQKISHTGD